MSSASLTLIVVFVVFGLLGSDALSFRGRRHRR